ncbi:MAG: ATP-binding response regulator [Limnospira sp.]
MSSPISLQTLIRRVPVCLQGITLDALWLVLSEGNHDCVVVVNSQQHPVGIVYLHNLTPYISPGSRQEPPLEQRGLDDRLIEPLLLVPGHLHWKDFWTYLQHIGQDLGWNPIASLSENDQTQGLSPIALIDEAGQFLGLIDLLKLLQLAVMKPPGRSKPRKSVSRTPVAEASQHFPFVVSLLQLLEPLPLPMMLQTERGQVLGQNLAWRSQVGNEPEAVRDAARTVTQWNPGDGEKTDAFRCRTGLQPEMGRVAGSGDPSPNDSQMAGSTLLQTATAPEEAPHVGAMPPWCHLSSSPGTYVCICPTPEGQERVWQFARQPLKEPNSSQTPTGLWLILAQDITEQHRVAQELAAKNADLIQLNRLKDEFLACISHELKTPLTAVLGLSSLLKDRSLGELSDRQARYAKLIHQSGRHLMMVVNDILDLTRIETEQLELVPEGADIRAVCDRALETARQLQRQDRAGNETESPETQDLFSLEIEPDLEIIEADELRLRQMLVNLISNAFKFTPEGGSLGLRVGRWEDWIAFTVWDTGIGIPEEKQHLIFEKFQQLESPLTRKFEGTGLGLVLTQRLARLHGGDVSFISKHGEGSQFTLLLPPAPPQKRWKSDTLDWEQSPSPTPDSRRRPPTSTRPTPQVQSRLILIVEAVPRFIHDLSDRVANLGYRAIVARTGTEAVEKARRLQPRVIFLNPLLPLLSGWDVLTLLKTDAETRQIPVFITATLGEKKRAAQGCCDGFLSLPVQKSDLQLALTQLEQRPVPEPAKRLTVLWLSPVGEDHRPTPALPEFHPQGEQGTFPKPSRVRDNLQLPDGGLPHRQRHPQISHCRILEADDLNQAELLARIWHPDAIVLDNTNNVEDPVAFLQEFGEQEHLANIPLVTLDAATTAAANQIETLSVFPCLASQAHPNRPSEVATSALLQVIQVAAGMSWKPNILVVDLSTLPDFAESEGTPMARERGEDSPATSSNDPTGKIERALIQYLQTAGFRGSLGRSWEEILQQLQCLSVDLLLICVRDPGSPLLGQALSTLLRVASPRENPLVTLPPILILDHSSLKIGGGQKPVPVRPVADLPADLRALMDRMAIEFLSGQISMAELLNRIRDRI